MKKSIFFMGIVILFALLSPSLYAHCEVPCGIYNDNMRFAMIAEHIETITKAMEEIALISKGSPQNINQLVRWIMNKEKHAEEIQHIISQYFLTQRIKTPDFEDKEATERYFKKITLCHEILVWAMKTKQTIDPESVKILSSKVDAFRDVYFPPK